MTFQFTGVTPELRLEPDIAIVGASPRLKQQALGEDIDGHAEVIRINDATIAGHEAHVGSRTTLRFIGRTIRAEGAPDGAIHARIRAKHQAVLERAEERILGHERNIEALQQMLPGRAIDVWKDYRRFVRDIHVHARKIPGLAYGAEDMGRGFLPNGPFRSGLVLIVALLRSSKLKAKIHVYGFDASGETFANSRTNPYHYYEKFQPELDGWKQAHIDPAVEAEVLQQLHAAGYIVLY